MLQMLLRIKGDESEFDQNPKLRCVIYMHTKL